ncbi:MAG: SagB/ThcOx family dehydrogenase [Bacteroides sp.]|nr:SagB/ThcOx family dehydrogenase [Roseburia sp.]MCM1347555.1 SagB/ThcOx family dehydrogenase [Bacteroides sp.]MCM1420607.1 SagB/ThcOx family dehydrogenase [Bacteroides sp.]
MKKLLIATVLLSAFSLSQAQDIKLKSPDTKGSKTLTEALWQRQSVREYSAKELTDKDLSNLVWAASGINRKDSGKHTNPTAMNLQEVILYVFNSKGVYLYDAATHTLVKKADGDHRNLIADRQEFAAKAPLSLLMVADISKYKNDNEHARLMGAVDVGIVSQNINLYCAANGLCTVPRGTMNQAGIRKLLGLTEQQIPLINNPVGYPK